MEVSRCLVLSLEGTASEITDKLNEALQAIQEEGGRILSVETSFAKEHGIDGFVVLYTIFYTSSKPMETE